MFKKITGILLAASITFSLTACGGTSSTSQSSSPASGAPAPSVSSTPAGGQKFEFDIALHTKDGTSEEACASFKKTVEEKTDGNVVVSIFENGTLGTEAENITQVSTGEITSALLGSLYPQQVLPEYNASGIPFAFPDVDAVEEYWNGPVGDKMRQISIESTNLRLVGLVRRGPRQLTANKEIKTPADLTGIKLRLPENAAWVAVWKSLGANPTPVNWNEVYTSLQTNVVNAQENPIATYYSAKIQEVQSHTMLTNHINQHFAWVINENFFNSLPPEYQTIITDAIGEAVEWAKQDVAAREAEYKQNLIDEGHIFVEVDIAEWQQAAKEGIMEAAQELNDDAKNAIMAYIG